MDGGREWGELKSSSVTVLNKVLFLLGSLKRRSHRKAKVFALCPQPDTICCQQAQAAAEGGDERFPSPNPKIVFYMHLTCLGNFLSSEHWLSVSSQIPWSLPKLASSLWKAEFTQREGSVHMDRSIGFSPLTEANEIGGRSLGLPPSPPTRA